ncbi:MAG: ATP-dependent DNA helicase RecG [Rhodocyclaceae bacterium]|nr:MAG: ATP-dependent DNA helicase RecG [Rhodocyclaceae bacterium]
MPSSSSPKPPAAKKPGKQAAAPSRRDTATAATATAAVSIPGVTPLLADKLFRLGIRRDEDLALHLPLRYEDETRLTPLADALPGLPAQYQVEVVHTEVGFRPRRQLICHTQEPGSGETLLLRFLNFYPNQQKALEPGALVRLYGEVRSGFFGSEMVHPRFRIVREDTPLADSLTPVYPTTAGLGQGTLQKHVRAALERVDLSDTLPEALRKKLKLMPLAEAVHTLHHPPPSLSMATLEERGIPAWTRIRFDELLAQQLSLRLAYAARREKGAPRLLPTGVLTQKLLDSLPFQLTGAQRRAWQEIAADLGQPHPMQRLLQGDVGSGKTIVAALAMLHAAEAGYQSALMAPTEILAEQHYRKLAAWLEPLGLSVAWLTGSQKKKDKALMMERIASGATMLAVGTHALIEEDIQFRNMGLAIVDEQHRFGVRQRLALRQKGTGERQADPSEPSPPVGGSEPGLRAWGANASPHQLTMSATPIPRTLAMSFYADLDVSALDELPPGRTPVVTKLVSETRRHEVVGRVHDAVLAGRQAYWVCPLIEESEALQLKTAQETYEHLSAELPDLKVGLVHGRLKPTEKAIVMEAFLRNEIQVLVATTVIEVGVDVPNASLMVIEHAERFGLSQLHQLRGRVGRGTAESACVLLFARPLSETASQRLKIIYENTDGFEIARQDLQLRGPGEFIGARQSGVPMLRYATLEDAQLVEQARDAAEAMIQHHPEAVQRHIQRWLRGAEEMLKA